jgi:hypothetical protein
MPDGKKLVVAIGRSGPTRKFARSRAHVDQRSCAPDAIDGGTVFMALTST